MKYFAILSALILLLTLVGVGYLYMTTNIYVEAAGVITTEASNQPALFASLRDQARLGAVVGASFGGQTELGEAEDYQFCVYTVRLRNGCRVQAESVEVQISPMSGDVLQFAENDYLPVPTLVSVPVGGTADASAVLLTTRGNHTIREVTVTYYMWGIPFTLKTTVK